MTQSALKSFPVSLVLADPHLHDCPIVYVNKAFTATTGYSASFAVGRNCRFLQGKDTREEHRQAIRDALRAGREVTVDIANYRVDGSKFINRLVITPLHSDQGDLIYYLGLQVDRGAQTSDERRISELDQRLRELQHRVKNHLSMILGLIRMQVHADDARAVVEVLSGRVSSLSLLYDEFWDRGEHAADDTVDAGAYISRVASVLHEIDGRSAVRLNIDVDPLPMSIDDAGRLGLAASEVITNAFRHGFVNGQPGELRVSLSAVNGHRVLAVTDNGRGLTPGDWPRDGSLGSRIVTELVERINGRIEVTRPDGSTGTRVAITF